MPLTARYLTPPAYADQLGVYPAKVHVWIKNGELRAINVATKTTGRPLFRIPLDAIVEFESRRSVQPVVKAKKRKREQKRDDDLVEYF